MHLLAAVGEFVAEFRGLVLARVRGWAFRVGGLLVAAVAVWAVFAVSGAQTQRNGASQPSFKAPEEAEFAPGRIIVKLKEEASPVAFDNQNRRNNARVERELPQDETKLLRLPRDLPVREAVRRYNSYLGVEYAEPDYLLAPTQAVSVNDPEYPRLHGLNNTGQGGGVAGADISAPAAWTVTTGSDDVVVAVIDTGVDISHPDLRNNLWTNADETRNGRDDDGNGYIDDVNGWDFYNNNASVYNSEDGDEHGTHVAGTIAAEGNNGIGVTGVAWNVKIMPLKFLGPNGGYTSDAVRAIDYALDKGAKVSNNSWGGAGASRTLKDAITRAEAAGHLFVAAAGNAGQDNDVNPSYPASYDNPNIVSVAATNNRDELASFSNYGAQTVDVGAPGVGIFSTLPNNSYGSYNGTSMAAPYVSGIAALLLSNNNDLRYPELKDRILRSTVGVSSLRGKTRTEGRVDAGSALEVRSTALSFTARPLTIAYGGTTGFSGRLTADGEPVAGERVQVQHRPAGTRGFSRIGSATTASDGTFGLSGVKPDRNTDYRARFAGSEAGRLAAATSESRKVNVRVRVSLGVSSGDLKLGRSRVVSGAVTPTHGGSVRMVVQRNGNVVERRNVRLNDSRYRFTYKPERPGRYSFRATYPADDDHLGAASPTKGFRVVR